MIRCPTALLLLAAAAVLAGSAVPAPAGAQQSPGAAAAVELNPEPDPPKEAAMTLSVRGAPGGRVKVARRVRIVGTLRPWASDQRVTVKLRRGSRTVMSRVVPVHKMTGLNIGRFSMRTHRLVKPGRYRAKAVHLESPELGHASAATRRFRIRYPALAPGARGRHVRVFNKLLRRQGYVPSRGRTYGSRTARAVLAFRKVNGMRRITSARPSIFRKLAAGRGTFRLRYPGAGRHVEVSIARQVMVLARRGRAVRIYHVSTGAPATPTIRGVYRFYGRQPGYNSVGMYYSTYFRGGYAIHGYRSVPIYPASHGCVRTPIPDARAIYRWLRLGMKIYLY